VKRYNFHLPEQIMDELRDMSEETGLTVSELIRRALSDFLKQSVAEHE
jgi:metal-responsive CopG/Arc/MetJ family transcriptional regulator